MIRDLELALRSLSRQRTFTAVALLTLALGIAATTTMFTVVDSVLLRRLPYRDPDRLVQLSEVVPGGTPAVSGPIISNLTIHAWEPQRRAIGPIVYLGGGGMVTIGGDPPIRVTRRTVGVRFFDVLGLPPVAGRFFTDGDALADAAPVVVVSQDLARTLFGREAAAIEQTITVDDRAHLIIGIAPPGIALPSPGTKLWSPASVPPSINAKGETRVEIARAIARLVPGATPAAAAAEGTTVARSVARPIAADMLLGKGGAVEIHARTVVDQLTMGVRPALIALSIGVALLLFITCVNVANLFLSRGARRERDYAVRVALGAGRRHLMRETIAEAAIVSVLGGVAGAGLAWALITVLPVIVPPDLPRFDAVAFGWKPTLFAAGAAIIAGMLTGVVPAIRAARPDLLPALRQSSGTSDSRRTHAAHRMLLASEAALAMMLSIGAVVMGRSFLALVRIDPGYDAGNVLTARVFLPGASRNQAQTQDFIPELLSRLRSMPRVVAAGAANMAPFAQSTYVSAFELPVAGGAPVVARTQSYVVTPGYTEALALRVRHGRPLHESDLSSSIHATVVNEEFVRLFLQNTDPLGLRFEGQFGAHEIVGVVANVLRTGLNQQPQAEIYMLTARGAEIRREIYLVIRTTDNPAAHAAEVRQIVAAVRRDAAIDALEPLTKQLSDSVAQPRLAATIVASLAGLALLLAAIGLYGVLTYSVTARTREIGIRSALGASATRIGRSVVRDGVIVTGTGLLIGVGTAALATKVAAALLSGIASVDWISLTVAAIALLTVAIVASLLPAIRAIRVDPVVALKAE
jgi:predicted permease